MNEKTINVATNVKCPCCQRKLCKIVEVDEGKMIEFKHKGAVVLTIDAIIKCIDCERSFSVNAKVGLIEETSRGR